MARTNTGGGGGGNVSGSGAVGQVAFWDGANSITGSSYFTYDQATGQLLIMDANGAILQVLPNANQVLVGRPTLTSLDLNAGPLEATLMTKDFFVDSPSGVLPGNRMLWINAINMYGEFGDVNGIYSSTRYWIDPTAAGAGIYGLGNYTFSAITFTGSGLDDLTYDQTAFTGLKDVTYTVTIDSTGGTDTFSWTDTLGNSNTNVPCSVTPIILSDNMAITFGAVTGHTLGEEWTFDVTITRGPGFAFSGAYQGNKVEIGDLANINNSTLVVVDDKNKLIEFKQDGWVTDASAIEKLVTVPVSATDLATLGSIPIQLIPAPGVGKYIEIVSVAVKYNYGTTAYIFGGAVVVNVGGTALYNPVVIDSAGFLSLPNSIIGTFELVPGDFAENAPAELTDFAGDPAVAGDGDCVLNIAYRIRSF